MTEDRELVANENGWTIPLKGNGVAQILIDYRLSLRLGTGVEIIIETPITLRNADGEHLIDPAETTQLGPALLILHQIIRSAVASRDGKLELSFYDRQEILVYSIDEGENWQVLFPDGRMLVGLPGGEVAAFPARDR